MSAISSILKHFESRQFKDIFTIFCIFIDNIFPRFLHSSFLRAAQHSARHVMAAKLSSLCIMFAVCIVSIITTSTVLYVSTLYISTIYLQYLQYIYTISTIYLQYIYRVQRDDRREHAAGSDHLPRHHGAGHGQAQHPQLGRHLLHRAGERGQEILHRGKPKGRCGPAETSRF